MTFVEAVKSTPSIEGYLQDGLQALTNVDRHRVSCDGRRLRGSVNLDSVLRRVYPNETRWDYGVGFGKTPQQDCAIWLEVHAASSLHIDEVLAKLQWLVHWLKSSGPELDRLPRCFCWIATGKISFGRGSPQAKRIAVAGLQFPVKHLDLERLFPD